jgi:2-succinyl-6-hydroxy-2,4-cyclohexadiene-1-carboxylate synthase
MLSVRRSGTGPPVVALHGFTLTGGQFAPAARRLGRTVIAPDLPGHGGSVDVSTAIGDTIESVASLITSIGGSVALIGYSQGARLALMTALDRPENISALVLVSANAGVEDPVQRRARAHADAEVAARLAAMTLDDFLDDWTSDGITSTRHLSESDAAADREMRLGNTAAGLADAITGYGQGAQPSLWHRLGDLTMPTLVMSGSRDRTYCEIARRLTDGIPRAESATIGHAGHNPLLDAPDDAYGVISGFLDRHG